MNTFVIPLLSGLVFRGRAKIFLVTLLVEQEEFAGRVCSGSSTEEAQRFVLSYYTNHKYAIVTPSAFRKHLRRQSETIIVFLRKQSHGLHSCNQTCNTVDPQQRPNKGRNSFSVLFFNEYVWLKLSIHYNLLFLMQNKFVSCDLPWCFRTETASSNCATILVILF